jgi:hypothetical protein
MRLSKPFSVAPNWVVLGHYEDVATGLPPIAQTVVEKASIKGGERVLDLEARTGNSAIVAAQAGGDVTVINAEILRILEAGNEVPGSFKASLHYALGTATRSHTNPAKPTPHQ